MKLFNINKFSRRLKENNNNDNTDSNKHNSKSSDTVITSHTKICTIPVYLWKDELRNINKTTIMNSLLDYDYYNYALDDKYKSVSDYKRWMTDGDTVMNFRIYEIRVEISYQITRISNKYYNDNREYKDITSIKYLGLCRRVPIEHLGIEKIFINGDENNIITSLKDIDKIHKMNPFNYSKHMYYSKTKDSGLSMEFLTELYNLRIKHITSSYDVIRRVNNLINSINVSLEETKSMPKDVQILAIMKSQFIL